MAKHKPLVDTIVTNSPAKFSLYVKTREIKEISKALENIMLLPKDQRDRWVEDHGEFMNEAFNDYIDDSSESFEAEGAQFDDEMVELSQELVMSIQETFNRVHKILSDHQKLKS